MVGPHRGMIISVGAELSATFPITSFQGGLLHGGLQKIEGWVDEFTEIIREIMVDECSCASEKSRGKLPPQIGHIVWPILIISI